MPLVVPAKGISKGTAGDEPEEGEDDVKSVRPLRPGLHTCYNPRYKALPNREVELIAKKRGQFGLKAAIRLHEAGVASKRVSAMTR